MRPRARSFRAALVLALLFAGPARADLAVLEPGFTVQHINDDLGKQAELTLGPDSCMYHASFQGLKRYCAGPQGLASETICDSTMTFVVGLAFSTGGSFGNAIYAADYGLGVIRRGTGCGLEAPFATVAGVGALALSRAGSPYGEYLYTCVAFQGPIERVDAAGTVTAWIPLITTYLKFGPGGAWGADLYATDYSTTGAIDRVSPAGTVTPVVPSIFFPEGFDWAFDGDMFATAPVTGTITRVHPDGSTSDFATLPGAADVAFSPAEQALYVISNQGGFYRITRSSPAGAPPPAPAPRISVLPNPARGACSIRFSVRRAGLASAVVLDAAGRRVCTLPSVWRPAGAQALAWDGRDAAGAAAPPGEYFVRVRSGAEAFTARVSIVR